MNRIDPVTSNPEHYRVIFENEFVRVLDYSDEPGDQTAMHSHPNSVMVTLTGFDRRLHTDAGDQNVTIPANKALWLPAQNHLGENIGSTDTHVIFVELKGDSAGVDDPHSVGPALG